MSNDDADLNTEERHWADGAGKALRASEAQLDAVTVARLRAARAQALELTAPLSWSWGVLGLPALTGIGVGAALAVAVLAWTLLSLTGPVPGTEPPVNLAGVDALELLTDEQGPEFYQNLDLYLWLEDQGQSGDSA